MKILHLYHDIMNLYGEYGNIKALERLLEKNGYRVTVDKLTIGDDADINDYDFIYIGAGTESNQKLVLEDFKKYRNDIEKCIESGKVILMTGNSFEMLGKSITDCCGNTYEGLALFDFETTEQNKKRITGDIVFYPYAIVGFINKCSEISGIKDNEHLFTVKHGIGDQSGSTYEGVRRKNFFGTHVTGPILMKNPAFLEHIADLITGCEDDENGTRLLSLNTDCLAYERQAYEITLNELTKRFEEN